MKQPRLYPNRLYAITRPRFRAFGRPTGVGNNFVVFAGSLAVLTERPNFISMPEKQSKSRRYRTFLIKEGILASCDGRLIFTQDFVFTSPSNAATVVLGNPSDGYAEWKPATPHLDPSPSLPGFPA